MPRSYAARSSVRCTVGERRATVRQRADAGDNPPRTDLRSPTVERMPEASPARSSKRMPRPRAALAALACALLLGTTACSSADADDAAASPAPPSAASAAADEPIFASDEEALAAAVEAYEAYADASARVANAGGEGSESISSLVGAELDALVQEEFAALRESGLRSRGENVLYNPRLDANEMKNGVAQVTVLYCRDVSGTQLVRDDGSDATPAVRDLIQAVKVHLVSSEAEPTDLIVSRVDRWEDEEGC